MSCVKAVMMGVLLSLAALPLGIGRAAAAPLGVLAIRPNVVLSADDSGPIRLSEMVDPGTISLESRSEVIRHLQAVELTDRPAMGEERVFSEEGLRDVVAEASRRLETAGLLVEWRIPHRSTVFLQTDREKVAAAVRSELARFCDQCVVTMTKVDWPLVDWRELVSWRVKPLATRPRGSFAVGLEISTKGGQIKSVVVSGMMTMSQTVPVLTRSVGAGEKIVEQDVQMVVRDVTYATDSGARVTDFVQAVVSRGIAAGDVLWRGLLRRELILKFGDPVRVQVVGDSWNISTDGIAQSPAAVGDTVKVKVNRSQKLVSGILKEKGIVEIQ